MYITLEVVGTVWLLDGVETTPGWLFQVIRLSSQVAVTRLRL
jgi:hypothetical protein